MEYPYSKSTKISQDMYSSSFELKSKGFSKCEQIMYCEDPARSCELLNFHAHLSYSQVPNKRVLVY